MRRAQDPIIAELDEALDDDEEFTEEDENAVREGLSEPGVPWLEAEPELRAE